LLLPLALQVLLPLLLQGRSLLGLLHLLRLLLLLPRWLQLLLLLLPPPKLGWQRWHRGEWRLLLLHGCVHCRRLLCRLLRNRSAHTNIHPSSSPCCILPAT
jgi:hypothetical protein